ncbi:MULTISPECIES: type VI secretion system lipoprotein TssJ [unclassified Chelatococcus]|uniref:type VI secretion system lipoprotein TssJ n=1 Tax=unclassified Chelatococcus TaxID=2638111 RepID=UPI001BCCC21D|nr:MULTISPECIES: type VI secretion system lipoprotein TssJ [unclassified Chelatococcus]MBS7697291.1 type VI secretion system lipoprotein TssJ [Chelatococcus sp. YT9]MBX3556412.1 type VI secretion system lipoprotein TssJ [Chelatococcus sp.]
MTCLSSIALGGCASNAPSRAAMLDATIVAGPTVNPDDDGRASPVVVEIFELSSLTPFQDANFDSLYTKGKQTLGDSLLATHSTVVSPGARKAVSGKLAAQTSALGVIAGFAHFDRLQWRSSFQTQPGKDAKVAIAIDGSGIVVQPAR